MNLMEQELLEKDLNQRMLARARQKKFYQKHRLRILQMRKIKRDNYRQLMNAIRPARIVLQQNPNMINVNEVKDYTKDEIIQLLRQRNIKDGTKKVYIETTTRIFNATKQDSLYEALKNPEKIIDDVESLMSSRNKLFAKNSKKGIYQAIIYIISSFMDMKDAVVKNAHTILKSKFREYHYESKNDAMAKTTDERYSIPSFDEYLQKCKEAFGQESKQYLISLLYSLCTVRDDFKNLIIIANEEYNDGLQNYLRIDNQSATFYINIFKTKTEENPDIIWSIPMTLQSGQELHRLLSNYLIAKNKQVNDNVFGKTSLSSFVGKIHEKIGYKMTSRNINLYRQMKASDASDQYRNKLMTFAERQAIVSLMSNSLLTNDSYVRMRKTN